MTSPPPRTSFETRAADWLGVEEARARVLERAEALEVERVGLAEAHGRALAEALHATARLPPWDNSAMDGYAVRAADLGGASPEAPVALRVVGRVMAGSAPGPAVSEAQAVRIMTGAPLPPGADCVVRVEDTDAEAEAGVVRVRQAPAAGQNVRAGGEDMSPGDRVLDAGDTLTSGAVGLAAALGLAEVAVHRVPTVAVLTTGDELRGPERYDDVRSGIGIPESNGPMLAAMTAGAGGRALPLGVGADDPEDLRRRIGSAAEADVLLTVGGASMGEADLVKRVLDEAGFRQDFWRVRIRPGSPFSFGWLPRGERLQPVFGLPGNPGSAFVTFELFVRPFLLRLAGHTRCLRRVVPSVAAQLLAGPPRLTRFLRVSLEDGEGPPRARLTGPQGSGLVRGLARAGGLAIVPEGVARIEEGGEVDVMLLDDAVEPAPRGAA